MSKQRMAHVEILPAILVKNSAEFHEKLRIIEPHVSWAHLDVMDGKFVPNVTWGDPGDLMHTRTSLHIEAHLMVERPEAAYRDWILAGARRLVWHYEATRQHRDIAQDIRARGAQAGIALNPETGLDAVTPLLSEIDMVLIMANTPGFGGQEFRPETPEKIRALRRLWPDGMIGVDIGVRLETARAAVEAGADILVAGSFVFNSESPAKAIEELRASLPQSYGDHQKRD